ncbi:acyltransferase family protein [Nocardioides mesophilus]|uniref:Acyltransferase family protein n=1 Tax=Nocardioides mesophilus TaxID=433659 RepID=A0A7G9R710_9ACTN|nr:acyltransferase family protein [Nocardioides mesophilus]QNN51385.1 acyltransferase family protein [Nocardioides mesophilus]
MTTPATTQPTPPPTGASAVARSPQPASGRPSSRDAYFDNAKLVLVTLVVVGHAWTLIPDTSSSAPTYYALYAFHVPAFVLVTGYLSRGFRFTGSHLRKLATTVVVPYLVFESLLALFRVTVGGEHLGSTLYLDPHWPMWYLAVLFTWRLATPLLRRVRQPMLLAVVVCLLGGIYTGDTLDLARAMGLLPFFVAGLTMRREQFTWLARPRVRVFAAAALVTALVVATFVAGPLSKEWLYWRTGYADLGVGVAEGMAARLVLLVVAGVLALSALSLIPTTHRWFTTMGSASLVVYLFHGFAVKSASYAGVGGLAEQDPVTAFVLITLAAVGLSLLLAATPVARRLNALIDPISTVSTGLPGPVDPAEQRLRTQAQLALAPRRPNRLV